MEEKRRFIRFKLLLKAEIESQRGSYLPIEIVDFSRKGLRIFSSQSIFSQTDPLKIRAFLPGSPLSVSIQARFRWSQARQEGYETGAELDWIELAAKNEILDIAYNKWKEKIEKDYASVKSS